MSADNTIAILITRRRDGSTGNEYRLAHVQAVENIEFEADYPSLDNPLVNRDWVLQIFGRSSVFQGLETAYEAARRLEKAAGYVEYGIRLFDYRQMYFPASNRRKRQRERYRIKCQYQQSQSC